MERYSKFTKAVSLRDWKEGRLLLCTLHISEFLQRESAAFEIFFFFLLLKLKVIFNVSNLGRGHKNVFSPILILETYLEI